MVTYDSRKSDANPDLSYTEEIVLYVGNKLDNSIFKGENGTWKDFTSANRELISKLLECLIIDKKQKCDDIKNCVDKVGSNSLYAKNVLKIVANLPFDCNEITGDKIKKEVDSLKWGNLSNTGRIRNVVAVLDAINDGLKLGNDEKLYLYVEANPPKGSTPSEQSNKTVKLDDFSRHLQELIRNGKHQIILTGAPGAGKTYTAKQLAIHFLDPAEDGSSDGERSNSDPSAADDSSPDAPPAGDSASAKSEKAENASAPQEPESGADGEPAAQVDTVEPESNQQEDYFGENALYSFYNASAEMDKKLCWKPLDEVNSLLEDINNAYDTLQSKEANTNYPSIIDYVRKFDLELDITELNEYKKLQQGQKKKILEEARRLLPNALEARIEELKRKKDELEKKIPNEEKSLKAAKAFVGALIEEILYDDSFCGEDDNSYWEKLRGRSKVKAAGQYTDDKGKEKNVTVEEVRGWIGHLKAESIGGNTKYNPDQFWIDLDDLRGRIKLVQFHPSYDYTDFVEGIRPVEVAGEDRSDGKIEFRRVDGSFMRFCRYVQWKNKRDRRYDRKFFFLVDEINRADIAKVFGELMYGLEEDKRDHPITTQYSNLATWFKNDPRRDMSDKDKREKFEASPDGYYFTCFENGFRIPPNVVVIGTMNEIDRSVESMDFAMRRRFVWEKVEVTKMLVKQAFENGHCFDGLFEEMDEDSEDIKATKNALSQVNELVAGGIIAFNEAVLHNNEDNLGSDNKECKLDSGKKEDKLGSEYDIAHGQFFGLRPNDLRALDNSRDASNRNLNFTEKYNSKNPRTVAEHIMEWVWRYRVEPLLREYLRGKKYDMKEIKSKWKVPDQQAEENPTTHPSVLSTDTVQNGESKE